MAISNGEGGQVQHQDQGDLSRRFWKLVKGLVEFSRLPSVVLRFHPDCSGREERWEPDVLQSIEFRSSVMCKTMAVLASLPKLPTELAIQHLQNIDTVNLDI
jgi:hypothetical protein